MSQSSVKDQVEDLKESGLPSGFSVLKGTRIIARDSHPSEDLRRFGSDLWFSRWTHNAFDNYPLVKQCLGIRFLHEACHGIPAFVVGVGPSLDDSISDLKSARGRSIIIATDAALRALLAAGITPDLVISQDCKSDQNRLWTDIPPVRIPILFNSCTHPNSIASWPGPILFFNQFHTQDDLCKRILPDILPELGQIPSAGTVGNMALMAAHAMGCDPVCAVGMDFCFQPAKSDVMAWRYRAQDWHFVNDRGAGVPPGWEKTEIKELYDNDERIQRSFMVKGENGKEYRMDPELVFYFDSFKDLMPHFKVPIVNCTPSGMIPQVPIGAEDGKPGVCFPVMTVGEAIDKYCKTVKQGGRTVLAHLDKIAPDPRKS